MFVDDEEDIVDVIASSLEEHGYSVESFTNPFEALERFKRFPDQFPVIVADIRMPSMTGVELSKEILKIRPTANIIFMTGLDINDNLVQKARLQLPNKSEFIQKPFRTYKLLNKLRFFGNASSSAAGRVDDVYLAPL